MPSRSGRGGAIRWVAAGVVAGLAVASVMTFRGVGRWLVREDGLRGADAIVVLSGGMPYRAEEAARVFRMGYAEELWLSRPEGPSDELEQMGIRYVGEEEYDREVLIHEGVPGSAIRVLPGTILDTEQEIEEVALQMKREGKKTAIIVTSPEHTRRVRVLWRRIAGRDITAVVHGAQQDPFDADHWWRDTRDTYAVVREILGLLNAWTGLRVRPKTA